MYYQSIKNCTKIINKEKIPIQLIKIRYAYCLEFKKNGGIEFGFSYDLLVILLNSFIKSRKWTLKA